MKWHKEGKEHGLQRTPITKSVKTEMRFTGPNQRTCYIFFVGFGTQEATLIGGVVVAPGLTFCSYAVNGAVLSKTKQNLAVYRWSWLRSVTERKRRLKEHIGANHVHISVHIFDRSVAVP